MLIPQANQARQLLEKKKSVGNQARSDPNAPDEAGKSPIYDAIRNGATEIVKILAPFLSEKPNVPDAKGKSLLHLAAGHSEISKILKDLV